MSEIILLDTHIWYWFISQLPRPEGAELVN
jgi:PIN domain nuclease of toxin-antitoxin system